nr:hypothetical protein [Sunxiuqinia sp.]
MKPIVLKSLVLLTASAGVVSCAPDEQEAKRPNIVFIMSDDHAYQAISA